MTAKVYQMLNDSHCVDASSMLLTGKNANHTSLPGVILPRWVPTSIKARSSASTEDSMQVLVHGNRYLSEYVYDPDTAMPASLVDAYDSSSILSHILAIDALNDGKGTDASTLLDLAGNEQSEQLLAGLAFSSQLASSEAEKTLRVLAGGGTYKHVDSTECKSTGSAMAAIALELLNRQVKGKVDVDESGECLKMSDATSRRWAYHLAPSVQRTRCVRRVRNTLLAKSNIHLVNSKHLSQIKVWSYPLVDTKSVW